MKGDIETIVIDDKKMSYISDFTGKSSNMIGRTVDDSQTNFKVLKRNNMFGNGFNRIERGYSEVKQALNQYLYVMNGYYDNLNAFQKDYISLVNGINVPKSYSINDVTIANNKENIVLASNNGNVLNSNNTMENVNLDKKPEIIKENLENINNNKTENVTYDSSSEIRKEEMNNIINEDEGIKNYDDNYSIRKEQLNEMTNNIKNTIKDYDDNYSIKGNDINDLEEDEVENVFDDEIVDSYDKTGEM